MVDMLARVLHIVCVVLLQVRVIIQLLRKKEVKYADLDMQKMVKHMQKVVRLVHKMIAEPERLDTLEIVMDSDPKDVHVGTHEGFATPFVHSIARPLVVSSVYVQRQSHDGQHIWFSHCSDHTSALP